MEIATTGLRVYIVLSTTGMRLQPYNPMPWKQGLDGVLITPSTLIPIQPPCQQWILSSMNNDTAKFDWKTKDIDKSL